MLASSLILPNFDIASAQKGTQHRAKEQNRQISGSQILKIALPAVAIAGVGGAILYAIFHSRINAEGKAFIKDLELALELACDKDDLLYILDYIQRYDTDFANDCSSELRSLHSRIEALNPENFKSEGNLCSKEILKIFINHATKKGIPLNSFPTKNIYVALSNHNAEKLDRIHEELHQTAERIFNDEREHLEERIRHNEEEFNRLREEADQAFQRSQAEILRQIEENERQQHSRRYELNPILEQMYGHDALYREFIRTGRVNGHEICMPHDEFIREFKAHFDRREPDMPVIQEYHMHVLPRDGYLQREFLERFSQSTNPELAKDLYAELTWLTYFMLYTDRDTGNFVFSLLPGCPGIALNQFITFRVPHFGRSDREGDSPYFNVLFDSFFYDEDNVRELKSIMSSVADLAGLEGDLSREQRTQNIESLNGLKRRCDALLRQYEGLDPTMTTVIRSVKELILDKHINRIQESLSAEGATGEEASPERQS